MELKNVTSGITTQQTGYAAKVNSKDQEVAGKNEKTGAGEGATYEKGSIEPKATYSINKMSKEERAALIDQLKADAAQRQSQFLDIVHKTISGQVKVFGTAGKDSIWQPPRHRHRKISEKTGIGELSRLPRGCLILQVLSPGMM